MAEREHVKKTSTKRTEEEVDDVAPSGSEKGTELKENIDDLLDEIDDVLEVNAEDFVKAFVQKGGE